MRTWNLAIALDPRSRTPLYRQVAAALAAAIRDGRLKTGDPLPGQRTLAAQLGVNRQTVTEAYGDLALEGWIETRHGGGSFVASAAQAPYPAPSATPGAGFPIPARRGEGSPASPSPTREGRDLLAAATGVPDLRLLPMAALSQAYHRALRKGGGIGLKEGNPQGHPHLREALAEMLGSTRSIPARPESLQITSGGQMAFYLLARILFREGDQVAVEAMGRREVWSSFEEAGAELVPLPIDDRGAQVETVAALADAGRLRAVYLTPQRQYPTTASLSAERRVQLLELARRHRLAVIEHDEDAELHYEGPPTLPLAADDRSGCVIHVGTLSRLFAPGTRLGFIHGPQALIGHLTELRRRVDQHGDQVLEIAMADLLRDGELIRHLARMRKVCLERRDAMLAALSERLGARLACVPPSGGMALWLRPVQGDPGRWYEEALARRVQVAPTARFAFPGQEVPPGFRLGFAAHEPHALREIAARLADVAERIHGPGPMGA